MIHSSGFHESTWKVNYTRCTETVFVVFVSDALTKPYLAASVNIYYDYIPHMMNKSWFFLRPGQNTHNTTYKVHGLNTINDLWLILWLEAVKSYLTAPPSDMENK